MWQLGHWAQACLEGTHKLQEEVAQIPMAEVSAALPPLPPPMQVCALGVYVGQAPVKGHTQLMQLQNPHMQQKRFSW